MVQDEGTARLVQHLENLDAAHERGRVKMALMDRERQVIIPWLRAHGIDPDPVYAFEIVISGKVGETTTITVQRYALNADGHRYYLGEPPYGPDAQIAKDEPITVPLICWPENV